MRHSPTGFAHFLRPLRQAYQWQARGEPEGKLRARSRRFAVYCANVTRCPGGASAMRTCLIAVVGSLLGASTLAAADAPTFYKDVLPILQANCQSCHRPGEVAPMSLLTYEQSRPWARAIKTAVTSRQMPPWSADPNYGHFVNERRLVDREIATLTAWADSGAAAGKDAG